MEKNKHEPGMAYDMEKLNKVFAFLSVIFLITVFWVFLDDYTRPWKKVQLDALKIKREKIQEKILLYNIRQTMNTKAFNFQIILDVKILHTNNMMLLYFSRKFLATYM